MKTETRIKRYAFIALLISLVLLSVSVAFVTYRYYGVVARGILGLILTYLLFYGDRYSKMDVSFEALLLDPKKGKYLIAALVVPLISYWTGAQIYEMILFFTKRQGARSDIYTHNFARVIAAKDNTKFHEDDMKILAMFLGVLLFQVADYLIDTFPTITIMRYRMDSQIIILPIFLLLIILLGFILEKKLRKKSIGIK